MLLPDPAKTTGEFMDKHGFVYSAKYLSKNMVIFRKQWVSELFKNKELEFEEAQEAFLTFEVIGNIQNLHDSKLNVVKIARPMNIPF
jgi:hypothetical protein